MTLSNLIVLAGVGQLSLVVAAVQIPSRLRWRAELESLPRLHRQMHWVYAGYVLLSVVAFAALSIFNARELTSGSALARGLCAYIALFWAVKVACQAVFDMTPYLTRPWMRTGDAADDRVRLVDCHLRVGRDAGERRAMTAGAGPLCYTGITAEVWRQTKASSDHASGNGGPYETVAAGRCIYGK